ncbi:MAG: phosphonoacetaldehyde reductase [Clostridia bacterium]|nr:phosphonoacetaldehyde reductase [Clostridia bacterium]
MSNAQRVVCGNGRQNLNMLLEEAGVSRPFLLCGKSFRHLPCAAWEIAAAPRFDDIAPNPEIADVRRAVAAFAASGCNGIVAIGGGSVMDTAKGVKAFWKTAPGNELHGEITDTGLPLIAVPTTAGSGSESTAGAVLYENGVKYSASHPSLLPGWVLLDGTLLKTLPDYQKKCTLLDALCQAIESHWSRKATEESRALAEAAIRGILPEIDPYLAGDAEAAQRMLEAANLAGQAICLTATTAPHAMSYKLTKLYGLPHGHAVAVCLPRVWRHMSAHGDGAIQEELAALSRLLGAEDGADAFESLLKKLGIAPSAVRPEDVDILAASVNPQRLSNHPLTLELDDLRALYVSLNG